MRKQEALPVPSESVEQQHLFQWARMMSGAHPELQLMYKIPNDGRRTRANGAHMVAEGLKKGVPDICLPVARGGASRAVHRVETRTGRQGQPGADRMDRGAEERGLCGSCVPRVR